MKIVYKTFLLISFLLNLIFTCELEETVVEEVKTNYYQQVADDELQLLLQTAPCTIPFENDRITQEEFLEKYAFKSPVIFKHNEFQSKRNQIFQAKSSIDNLLTEFADKIVTISTANTHSYKKYTMKLSDYLKEQVLSKRITSYLKTYGNETLYFFGDNNYTEWKALFELYNEPIYWLPNHEPALSFGVASAGSGVPFHFHGPGFAETMHGRKRWFLYPPDIKPEFHPDQSTLKWLIETYPSIKNNNILIECILEPFDIIYFPDRWWHATLNVDTAVFISTFLSHPFY